MPIFHFALRPRRYLFLGTSENEAASTDLFAPVDKKRRVFQRRDHVRSLLKLPSFSRGKTNLSTHPFEESPSAAGSVLNLRRAVDARIIERFAPAHVVVDGEGTVLHYSPRTGRYLEAAAGRPDRQLLAMARKGLRLDLRAALQETTKSQSRAERRGIPLDVEDRVHVVDLVVEPLVDTGSEPLFLVVFKDMPAPGPVTGEQPASATDNDANLERLERELHDVRERLQATVEEYDAALEELTSANEELQSTNEELETSREEMQSLNEELQTSNAELLRKVDEVHSAHDDLRNLINSTRIAVVFLDRDLVIRAFTPAATDIFNLISTDRGRPLTDIASNVTMTDLRRDIRTVYERDEPMERNVQGADGNVHYLMRLLPYRAENKRVEGVLVTFVDITGLVRAEARQRSLVEELNHRVRNMLMTVNVVAKQTLKRTPDPRAFAEAFTERIRAMADAYGLVVAKEQWRDVPLRDILATQLRPYEVAARDRVRLSGPEVLIAPNVAISLGMIAHELATNAAKYGALSAPAGRVSVDWGMKGGGDTHALLISWREEGGPAAHEPDRRGFGSELMEAEVRQKLHGSIDLEYRVEGFSADILIPTGNGVWE
jgi:two-component system CheB/CheR fusion protein